MRTWFYWTLIMIITRHTYSGLHDVWSIWCIYTLSNTTHWHPPQLIKLLLFTLNFHLNIITQEFILFFVHPQQSSNDFNARWRENKALACSVKHFIIKEETPDVIVSIILMLIVATWEHHSRIWHCFRVLISIVTMSTPAPVTFIWYLQSIDTIIYIIGIIIFINNIIIISLCVMQSVLEQRIPWKPDIYSLWLVTTQQNFIFKLTLAGSSESSLYFWCWSWRAELDICRHDAWIKPVAAVSCVLSEILIVSSLIVPN